MLPPTRRHLGRRDGDSPMSLVASVAAAAAARFDSSAADSSSAPSSSSENLFYYYEQTVAAAASSSRRTYGGYTEADSDLISRGGGTTAITTTMYPHIRSPNSAADFLESTRGGGGGDNDSGNTSGHDCYYEPSEYLAEKFALVTVFGTLICAIGFVNNCLLVHILARSSLIRTHVFYLAVLAVCDIVTELSYIALMSVQVLYDYTQDLQLYVAWNKYLRVVFTVCHVSLTVATYMIVSASAERYLGSSTSLVRASCTKRHRWLVTLAVCIFSFLSKGLVYWELEVVHRPNCTGFEVYTVQPSSLAMDPPYKVGFTLWFRHIAHVFCPFALLLILNAGILSGLKRSPLERVHSALVASTMGQLVRERKKSIRAATLMLGAIVSTYLVSNLLNVIITMWEHIDFDSLKSEPKFYTFAADVITLLTVLTGAIRLPIYCICNQQLRREFKRLCTCWRGGGKSRTILLGDLGNGLLCFDGKKKKSVASTGTGGGGGGSSGGMGKAETNQGAYYHSLDNDRGELDVV